MDLNTLAFQFSNDIASNLLNTVMVLLSKSYFLVIPLVFAYLYLKKDRRIYTLLIALFLALVIGEGIKYLFHIPRPCSLPSLSWINMPSGCESGFSFPSEHAVFLTGVILFLAKYRKALITYLVWLALILYGRVYLGQHYLTDVLVGIVLSFILFYVVYIYSDKVYVFLDRRKLAVLTPK